jgi:signal transduction histidine kinase
LLKVGTEIVGVMFINYRRPHHFSKEEKQLIETLSSSASIAIKNRRLMETVVTIDREIITTLDLDKLLKLIVAKAVQITDADVGDIRIFDPLNNLLEVKYRIPEKAPVNQTLARIEVGQGITGWVAQHKQPALIEDVRTDERFNAYHPRTLSELCVPLLDKDGALLGVLNMESRSLNDFDDKDQRVLEALANQAVIAIQNAQQQKRLVATETMEKLGDLLGPLVHKMFNSMSLVQQRTIQIQEYAEMALMDAENIKNWILESPRSVSLKEAVELGLGEVPVPEDIQLELQLPPDLPVVKGSQYQLRDVFANLIQNAVDAMPKGGQLTITGQKAQIHNQDWGIVTVEDTGRGIPRSDLEKIFEPHYSTKSTLKSFGFGLYWVRSYIERIGGQITVESKLHQGSKFMVMLPCQN